MYMTGWDRNRKRHRKRYRQQHRQYRAPYGAYAKNNNMYVYDRIRNEIAHIM